MHGTKIACRGLPAGELIPARKVILSCLHATGSFLKARSLRICWSSGAPPPHWALSWNTVKQACLGISSLAYLCRPVSFGIFIKHRAGAGSTEAASTWLAPLPVESFADKAALAAAEQELERALFSFFPGLEEAIEWRRAMHLPVVDGVEVNIDQTASRRPPFKVAGLENLFLVGDSTAAPGAGGDVGHESVLCCYRAIREWERN